MKRGTIARMTAMAITVLLMAMIRTDADPELWQAALITLGLYESVAMTIQIAQKEARKTGGIRSSGSGSRMPGDGLKSGATHTGR